MFQGTNIFYFISFPVIFIRELWQWQKWTKKIILICNESGDSSSESHKIGKHDDDQESVVRFECERPPARYRGESDCNSQPDDHAHARQESSLDSRVDVCFRNWVVMRENKEEKRHQETGKFFLDLVPFFALKREIIEIMEEIEKSLPEQKDVKV